MFRAGRIGRGRTGNPGTEERFRENNKGSRRDPGYRASPPPPDSPAAPEQTEKPTIWELLKGKKPTGRNLT